MSLLIKFQFMDNVLPKLAGYLPLRGALTHV
jgi:hypothetical protein